MKWIGFLVVTKLHLEWCCFCAAQVCFQHQEQNTKTDSSNLFFCVQMTLFWHQTNTIPGIYFANMNDYCQIWTEKPLHLLVCGIYVNLIASFHAIGLVSILTFLLSFPFLFPYLTMLLLFCFNAFLLKFFCVNNSNFIICSDLNANTLCIFSCLKCIWNQMLIFLY